MSAYALPGLFPPLPKQNHNATSTYAVSSQVEPKTMTHDEGTSGSNSTRVGISVKEAKLDSALLIHSLASNETCGSNAARSRRRRARNDPKRETNVDSKDEAMKFELTVTFGAQKYTTTRSWPSICQFRKDLIRNVRSIEIPELPTLHPPGVLCRSFSFLQDLVCSYAPSLEGWLRTVTVLVPPDNPILSHFLHEEETEGLYCNRVEDKSQLFQKTASSSMLDAIEESETEEEDDDGVDTS